MALKLVLLSFITTTLLGTIPLLGAACNDTWMYPQGCRGTNCSYRISWRFNPSGDSISFTVITHKLPDHWTGVGFAKDRENLTNMDSVFAWLENPTKFIVADAFMSNLSEYRIDGEQSLIRVSGNANKSLVFYRFTRYRETGDEMEDIKFTDTCPYFIFFVDGGYVNTTTRQLKVDQHTPIVSDKPICCGKVNLTSPQPKTANAYRQPKLRSGLSLVILIGCASNLMALAAFSICIWVYRDNRRDLDELPKYSAAYRYPYSSAMHLQQLPYTPPQPTKCPY